MVILNKGSKVAAALWSDAFGGEAVLMIVTGTVEESTKSQVKLSPLTEKYLLADFAEDIKRSVGGHEVGKEERS